MLRQAVWACREWAGILAARAKELPKGERTPAYDARHFIVSNRHDQALHIAADLEQLADGPLDVGLPWQTRRDLEAALERALELLRPARPPASVATSSALQLAAGEAT